MEHTSFSLGSTRVVVANYALFLVVFRCGRGLAEDKPHAMQEGVWLRRKIDHSRT